MCPKCSVVANDDGPVEEGPTGEKKKRRKTKTPEVLTLGKTLDFVHDIIEKKILADITETESGQQPRSMTYFMRNYFILFIEKKYKIKGTIIIDKEPIIFIIDTESITSSFLDLTIEETAIIADEPHIAFPNANN